jgi:hypothetical protein
MLKENYFMILSCVVGKKFEIFNLELITNMEKILSMKEAIS